MRQTSVVYAASRRLDLHGMAESRIARNPRCSARESSWLVENPPPELVINLSISLVQGREWLVFRAKMKEGCTARVFIVSPLGPV